MTEFTETTVEFDENDRLDNEGFTGTAKGTIMHEVVEERTDMPVSVADMTFDELEDDLRAYNDRVVEIQKQLHRVRKDRAAQLREEAAELENQAIEKHQEADKLDPPPPAAEPPTRRARKVMTEEPQRKEPKRGRRKAQRKVATVHQKRKAAGKKGPGRPKGSKPQPPTMAEVVAVVKKGKGLTVAQIAERNEWDPRRVSARLAAAGRKELIENRGEGRDGVWYGVKEA